MSLYLAIQQSIVPSETERTAENPGDARIVESVPALVLGVPDSYLKAATRSFSLYALASLDVPSGARLPEPMPVAKWKQSGNRVTFDANPGYDQSPTALGAILVAPPATPGVTKILATVHGATAAEVDAYAYRALGIGCIPTGLPGGSTVPQGIAFDSRGRAHSVASVAASDIALTGTGCSGAFAASWSVSISVPHGSTKPFATTSASTSFTSMTAKAFANATTLVDPSGLSIVYTANTSADKLLFKTRDGRLVKFLAVDERFAPDPAAPGGNGPLLGLYGFYAVSDAKGRFAF